MLPISNRLHSSKLASLTAFLLVSLSACSPPEKPVQQFEVSVRGAYTAALSADGQRAVVGSVNHGASYWDSQHNERLYDWNLKPGQYTEATASAVSGNGQFALTASAQQMVLWDTQTGKAFTFFNAPAEILSVSLSRSGKYALLGLANYTAVLFDAKKGGVLRTLHHDSRVRSVHLSGDGQLALTGADDNSARLWDIKKGTLLHRRQHSENVQLVRLSPNKQWALSVSKYDKAALWNVKSGQTVAELDIAGEALKRGKSFTAAEFSADGNFLLTGSSNREVTLWDISQLQSDTPSNNDIQRLTKNKRWLLTKRQWMKPTGATVLSLAFAEEHIVTIGSNGLLYFLAY